MGIITLVNPEQVSETEVSAFTHRHAARAVVFDSEGRIALLHVTKYGYHKLPGGGVENGEDLTAALRRECREEIGCEILVGESLGEVHEYRREFLQHQISYCFAARVLGEKGVSQFMPDGEADGFKVEWFYPEESLMVLGSETPSDYTGKFILVRDIAIVRAAALQ
jgi:8-oxo-dGTP diphosphatase